jgi:DNA topoisomerase-6 subunit A
MAKKPTAAAPAAKSSGVSKKVKERDAKTQARIVDLADGVSKTALAMREPKIEIPLRTKSNTIWNKKRGILEMGDASLERELFNLNQAKQFMQTCLHANSIKSLIDDEKSLSLRGMFYRGLHTVAGTKEKTFTDQDESDGVLEDLEVSLGALREELHIFAKKKGTMIGNITLVDSGDEIDCRRMGSGGYSIPSIVEPDVMEFKKCDAKFVLHVEKDTVWTRSSEP